MTAICLASWTDNTVASSAVSKKMHSQYASIITMGKIKLRLVQIPISKPDSGQSGEITHMIYCSVLWLFWRCVTFTRSWGQGSCPVKHNIYSLVRWAATELSYLALWCHLVARLVDWAMLIEFENQEPFGMNEIRVSLVCKCFTNLWQTWKWNQLLKSTR